MKSENYLNELRFWLIHEERVKNKIFSRGKKFCNCKNEVARVSPPSLKIKGNLKGMNA